MRRWRRNTPLCEGARARGSGPQALGVGVAREDAQADLREPPRQPGPDSRRRGAPGPRGAGLGDRGARPGLRRAPRLRHGGVPAGVGVAPDRAAVAQRLARQQPEDQRADAGGRVTRALPRARPFSGATRGPDYASSRIAPRRAVRPAGRRSASANAPQAGESAAQPSVGSNTTSPASPPPLLADRRCAQ